MKKVYLFTFILLLPFVFGAQEVLADVTTPPTVSVGVGNGNTPENTGPTHNVVYSGSISVFATVEDDDLEAYHFRVIKDGGSQGHTCDYVGGLFDSINQGHASTTLSNNACGFNFNQSLYVSSGFTNSVIATLNADDLIAFAGEGDYWLVLGARDIAGNRSASDYLQDPKIKITIASTTTSVPVPTPVPASTGGSSTSSGGGGGNGPIVNSYGFVNPGNVSGAGSTVNTPNVSTVSGNTDISNQVADAGEVINYEGNNVSLEVEATSSSTATTTEETMPSTQTANAFLSGFNLSWLWALLALIIAGGAAYFFSRSKFN